MAVVSSLSAWGTNPYLMPSSSAPAATAAPANPFTTVSNTKSTEVDDRLKKLFETFDQATTSGAGALKDYTSAVNKATPAVTDQTAEDVASISELYTGKAAGDLAGIRARRKAAMAAAAAQRSLGDLSRALGATQLGMGGGGRSLGTGSFLSKLGLDKAAEINTKAAADDAEAEHGDFLDLLTRRLAASGSRQQLTDTLAGRSLLPYQAENQRLGAMSSALSALAQQKLLNTFYGLKGDPNEIAT